MLDWDALQEALQTALLEAVSAKAGGPWRVAALDQVYTETDGIITAPSLFRTIAVSTWTHWPTGGRAFTIGRPSVGPRR